MPALFALLGSLLTALFTFLLDKAVFRIALRVMLITLFTAAFFVLVNAIFIAGLNALTGYVINTPNVPGVEFMLYCIPTNMGVALSILAGYEFGIAVARWALKWLDMKFRILSA